MRCFLHRLFHIDHLLVTVMTFIIIGVFYVFLKSVDIAFLNPIAKGISNFSLSDVYYEIKQETTVPDTCPLITLVDMTELHSRDEIADVIDSIAACEPRVLGVDLIFESLREDLGNNRRLAEAAENVAPFSVFSCKFIDYNAAEDTYMSKTGSFFTSDNRIAPAAGSENPILPVIEAYTNVKSRAESSFIRELTVERKWDGVNYYSMPAMLVNLYTEGRAMDKRDRLINFLPVRFPTIRYDSVRICEDLIRDRIVLLGTMHEEADMHYTPLGKMAGMETLAYSTLTLLEQKNIREVSLPVILLLSFIICYITQVLQYFFVNFTENRPEAFFLFISSSRIFLRLFTFAWMGFLTWLSFILYMKDEIYVSMVLILLCIALVGEARGFYIATIRTLSRFHDWHFLRNSLYYNPEDRNKGKKNNDSSPSVANEISGDSTGADNPNLPMMNWTRRFSGQIFHRQLKMIPNMKRTIATLFIAYFLAIFFVPGLRAQTLVVYGLKGKVERIEKKKHIPVCRLQELSFKDKISIPVRAEIHLLDPANHKFYKINNAGIFVLEKLIEEIKQKKGETWGDVTAQYYEFLLKQMRGKSRRKATRDEMPGTATSYRDMDCIGEDSVEVKCDSAVIDNR